MDNNECFKIGGCVLPNTSNMCQAGPPCILTYRQKLWYLGLTGALQ